MGKKRKLPTATCALGEPAACLPNLDWYVGMMTVYFLRLCPGRDTQERYATIQQRHVLPIAHTGGLFVRG